MKQRKYSNVLEPEEGGATESSFLPCRVVSPRARRSRKPWSGPTEAISVHIAGLEAEGEAVPEEHEAPHLVTVTVPA